MRKNITAIAAIAAAALLLGGRIAWADTISVHSSPNSVASVVSPILSGPFTNDASYTYDIGFDSSSDVVAPGNGFMVTDFGPVDGYTLTGVGVTASTLASEFTFSQGVDGTGLSGFVNNTSGADNFLDPATDDTSSPTDVTDVQNAVFNYDGSSPYLGSSSLDLTLVLYTQDTKLPEVGNGFGVDESGIGGDLSFSLNSVYVPSGPATVPEPASFGLLVVGGLALARRRNRQS